MRHLLVLTSATGAGHDTHAQATVSWCQKFYGPEVKVTIAHALEDSHALYRHGVDFYNFIQRRMPWFHHFYYNFVELLEVLNPGTVSFGRAHYVKLLEATRPDAILSVHDCLNRGYFEVARDVLGPQIRCATYCTEFEGGYGFSRNWVNPRADLFFARTAEAAEVAKRRGVARVMVAGHWAPPAFYDNSRRLPALLLKELQLELNRFTLLLSTGGNAAQNHRSFLRELATLAPRIQVIALCGRDESSLSELEGWAAREVPLLTVRFLAFTERMPELLSACSAVVARGGATTAGEALLCGCPIIFNGLGGMMPQELPTLRYFRRQNISPAVNRATALPEQIANWLDHPDLFTALRGRIRNVQDVTTPRAALDALLA